MKLDASLIYPGLYQGSKPPVGDALRNAGFHVVVLCAMEYQFHGEPIDFVPFPGVRVIYAPNDDDPITPPHREHLAVALRAAREVSDGLRHGLKTLVTCWAGLNRSGLVTALSLHLLTGCSGFDAVRLVKRHRRHALSNPQFVDVLCRLKAVPQPGAEVELTL